MKLSEEDIIKLEAFWQGTLDADEQAELERQLQEDKAFQQAAEEWKLIVNEGFLPPQEELEEQEEIKKRMQAYAEESEPEAPHKSEAKPFRLRRLYIGLAAAAVLLLLLWLGPLGRILGPSSPADEFFAHLPRDNANLSDPGDAGKQAYDQQTYRKAYTALLQDVSSGGDSLNLIYASVAAIGSGQAEKAIPILEPLVGANNWQLYQSEIAWYLALAYVYEEQNRQAINLLEKIVDTGGEYSAEAQALLATLKE